MGTYHLLTSWPVRQSPEHDDRSCPFTQDVKNSHETYEELPAASVFRSQQLTAPSFAKTQVWVLAKQVKVFAILASALVISFPNSYCWISKSILNLAYLDPYQCTHMYQFEYPVSWATRWLLVTLARSPASALESIPALHGCWVWWTWVRPIVTQQRHSQERSTYNAWKRPGGEASLNTLRCISCE